MRKRMNRRTDRKVFRDTAQNPKAVNLGIRTYRGGIRF